MYKHFSNFIFRTPILPLNSLEQIQSTPKKMIEFYQNNRFIQEAIYLASPALYNEMQKISIKEKYNEEENRVIHSLNRYLSRMSTRSTPFALFAGCSLGEINQTDSIILTEEIKRKTRLDMFFLCKLSQKLLKDSNLRRCILFFPNSTIITISNKYRYIKSFYKEDKRLNRIIEVEKNHYLSLILKRTQKGAYINQLSEILLKEGIEKENAEEYIHELIDSQILVSEIDPSVTGKDLFENFLEALNKILPDAAITLTLKKIQQILLRIDTEKKSDVKEYQEIIKLLQKIDMPYEEKLLFQTDILRETATNSLNNQIIEELQSVMHFLNRLSSYGESDNLIHFKNAFINRYEEEEIPLAEALDPERGIGYPVNKSTGGEISPLLDNFSLPQRNNSNFSWINNIQSILLKKTIEALANQEKEIVLSDKDINTFPESEWNNLPATMFCMFEITKADIQETLLSLKVFSGSSGANLLTRFSHLDKNLESFIKEITDKEQTLIPDKILAEIAHLPDSRSGNILSRSHIREYEIVYQAFSDLPSNKKIEISDLMISIHRNKITLRSKKLDKEIIPRLTTAHNYQFQSTPIYRFLCDLQYQHLRGSLSFGWNSLENKFTFRPRVKYKNTILSPASWTILIEDIRYLLSIKDEKQLLEQVANWRNKIGLPEKVLLPDGDNELFVDWNNSLSINSFFSIIKKRSSIKLNEFLFNEKYPFIKDEQGNTYSNECIVVFHKDKIS